MKKQQDETHKCMPYRFQVPVKISNIDEREEDRWKRMDMGITEGKG